MEVLYTLKYYSVNKDIKNIAVIGLGLIGGSLAKALKINNYRIVGISKRESTINYAKSENVIDEGYLEINEESLKNIDLVFLTGPLDLIPKHIKLIGEIVKTPLILTDAGSTKQEICDVAKKHLPSNIVFIGGHPMAGTEKGGYTFSDISLFKRCAWILTPINDSPETKIAISILEKIILEIGAKPLISSFEKHDRAVSLVSHLPLLASIALCQIVRNLNDIELQKLASTIASSGYRDTTRIGGGNPEMNANILVSNIGEVQTMLPVYEKELQNITQIALEDPSKLQKLLEDVSSWRKKLYTEDGKNSILNLESSPV